MSLSFDVGEELEAIVEAVRGFAADKLRPRLREFEAAGGLPDDLKRECHELGLDTLALPERLGGMEGLDIRAATLCSEELAWGDVGAAVAIPGPRTAGAMVVAAGNDEQQRRLMAPFTDAETGWGRVGTIALVEGPFGLDPTSIETVARKQGDAWVLTGKKAYVQGAGVADLVIVLARVEGAQAGDPWDRLGLFAVEGQPQGLVAGERHRMLGLGAARWASLELRGVRVPAADRLGSGAPGEVRKAVLSGVARKKVLDAARLVGCARAACDYAFKYATERRAFGVPLFEHQGLAFLMADMATITDGLRNLVWEAAWALDQDEAPEAAHARAQQMHRQVAEKVVEVTSDAVQVLGGHGYIQDHPVEKWMRDARTLGLVDGLNDEEAALLPVVGG